MRGVIDMPTITAIDQNSGMEGATYGPTVSFTDPDGTALDLVVRGA
ncbi:MAG: hypothetical protein H7226_02020 [Salinibacterium sp.]|nr:hypothetical protein [Salinibacterium sp.]